MNTTYRILAALGLTAALVVACVPSPPPPVPAARPGPAASCRTYGTELDTLVWVVAPDGARLAVPGLRVNAHSPKCSGGRAVEGAKVAITTDAAGAVGSRSGFPYVVTETSASDGLNWTIGASIDWSGSQVALAWLAERGLRLTGNIVVHQAEEWNGSFFYDGNGPTKVYWDLELLAEALPAR